jgi:hypothetical protein
MRGREMKEEIKPSTESRQIVKTGRELDAAVAERVMGWVWMSRINEGSAWLFPPDSKDVDTGKTGIFGEPIFTRSYWPYSHGSIVGPLTTYDGVSRKSESYEPHYSESIEAAMQVVEKMREQGWSFACTLYEGKLPYASFCKGTVATSRNAEADSLPEAICRAALSAVDSQ